MIRIQSYIINNTVADFFISFKTIHFFSSFQKESLHSIECISTSPNPSLKEMCRQEFFLILMREVYRRILDTKINEMLGLSGDGFLFSHCIRCFLLSFAFSCHSQHFLPFPTEEMMLSVQKSRWQPVLARLHSQWQSYVLRVFLHRI